VLLTLDSSVIVAALRQQEEAHQQCLRILERVRDGQHIAIQPYTVLVEVAAAIKRRTGSDELAHRVARDLESFDSFRLVELDAERAGQAVALAVALGLRGMDAVVLQIAKEFETTFVSLDEELALKASTVVATQGIASFV
jgi:predicted nucleic acid-binding protein